MGVSDSKCRVSRLKTGNRTRTRSRCSNQVRIGLGIGLEVEDWSVSDSKSSLENGESGNSATDFFFMSGSHSDSVRMESIWHDTAEFPESPFSRLDFESETDQSWTSSPIPSPILTWLEHRYPIPSPIPSLKPRDSVFRV